jgi:hypothetical protein
MFRCRTNKGEGQQEHFVIFHISFAADDGGGMGKMGGNGPESLQKFGSKPQNWVVFGFGRNKKRSLSGWGSIAGAQEGGVLKG